MDDLIVLGILVLLGVIDLLALVKMQEIRGIQEENQALKSENKALKDQILSQARSMSRSLKQRVHGNNAAIGRNYPREEGEDG